MRTRTRRLVAALLLLALAAGASDAVAQTAAEADTQSAHDWIVLKLSPMDRPQRPVGIAAHLLALLKSSLLYETWPDNRSVEVAKAFLLDAFRAEDVDGGGVTALDFQLKYGPVLSRRRLSRLARWIYADLNGDGRVTDAEAKQAIELSNWPFPDKRLSNEQQVSQIMRADADHDGVATDAEALADARAYVEEFARFPGTPRMLPRAMDLNGDGTITEAEFRTAMETVVAEIDRNRDGQLSRLEILSAAGTALKDTFSSMQRTVRAPADGGRPAAARKCGFPAAGDALLAFVSAFTSTGVSSAAVGGDDGVVDVADIVIEPGERPIYIAAVTYHGMIWRVSGDVGRVVRFVAMAQDGGEGGIPRVGIIGVPADRVTIAGDSHCLRRFREVTPGMRKAAERLFGKSADIAVADFKIGRITLPRGTSAAATTLPGAVDRSAVTPGAIVWNRMRRYYPAGVIEIDPAAVVADLPVAPYGTLPHYAGLAQLTDAGKLRPEGRPSSRDDAGDTTIIAGHETMPASAVATMDRYVVLGKIRVPAGLSGSLSVRFVLPEGAPIPDGPYGHSIVTR